MLSFFFGTRKSNPKSGSGEKKAGSQSKSRSRSKPPVASRERAQENLIPIDFSGSVRSKRVDVVNPDIILLKNQNSIIYYNKKLKYPTMVIEVFKSIPQNAGIKRKEMGEPFGPDPRIPPQYQYTFDDYTEYCKLGGSFGHNAAAFLHKSSEREYKDTFLFSNISPQEIVFNTGLWLLFEHVSEEIIRKYNNAIIINGCVGSNGKVLTLGNGTKMSVPSVMYKIILYQKNSATSYSSDGRAKKVGKSHYLCFVAENRPYYIDREFTEAFRKHQRFDLSRYTHSLSDFIAKYPLPGIDPKSMVFDSRDASIMANKFRHDQITSSTLYGKIIYARSMEELQRVAPNPAELKGFLPVFYQYSLERLQGRSG